MSETQAKHMRTFYALIATQTLSLMGSRISGLAVGIWVYQETGDATPLSLVAFFMILPMVFASTIAGVLADRWDRRMVMVLSDAGQAVGTLLLLLSFASNSFELWHLYGITAIQSVFGVFQGPAFQASVTMLIPDERRDRANAIQQLTGPMSGILAPTLAAFVYAAFDVEGAILLDLATFVFAMIVVFSSHIPRPLQTAEGLALRGSIWKEALGGLTYTWSKPSLFWMMIYVSMINFLIGGVMVLSTPYVLARTGNDEVSLGIVLSILNLGGVIGGIIIGIWGGTRPRVNTIFPGIAVASVCFMLAGTSQSVVPLALTFFLVMLPLPMVNAMFMSIMQAKVPPDIQGRVFAVIGQFSQMLLPIAYLLAGPLADNVFEPAVGQTGWAAVAPMVGDGSGAGIGLMMVGAGAIVFVMSGIVYMISFIRNLETILPDYVATVQPEAEDNPPESTPDQLEVEPSVA